MMHDLQAMEPLVNEHQLFKDQLSAAVKSGGNLGKIVRNLADILDPHFKLEEERAFPPLILILPLSLGGEITPDMKNSLELIDWLRKELPKLSDDHHTIIRMLEDFDDAVRIEGKSEFSPFSSNLITMHTLKREFPFLQRFSYVNISIYTLSQCRIKSPQEMLAGA